jgi:hypothetical protein
MDKPCRFVVGVVLLLVAAMILAAPAQAHVARDVGPYHFLVGWGTEPAYAGQMNSVQLILTYRAGGKPVLSLGPSFSVTVIYGSQKLHLPLEPTFDPDTGLGTPGDYRGWMVPTAPGNYTFHFTGTLGGRKIDESFTSSPTTFATVEDPAGIEFPLQAPTNAELAQRLLSSQQTGSVATTSQVSSAQTLGVIGIIVGAGGLAAAGAALLLRRS